MFNKIYVQIYHLKCQSYVCEQIKYDAFFKVWSMALNLTALK